MLSKAFKFTEHGSVKLDFFRATEGWSPESESLSRARSVIGISVSDTGIGIPSEKQQIIFEPFLQAEGSTNRKYGGTGLGLAISREIAGLLGGEIRLSSAPGAGSTFTLYIPQTYVPKPTGRVEASAPAPVEAVRVEIPSAPPAILPAILYDDDRENIQPGDPVVLIVDNDESFTRVLQDQAHEVGMKSIVTARGADAVVFAREKRPDAITLDIRLPDIDGWRVLDRLKNDTSIRHIPVWVITTEDEGWRGRELGAIGFLQKPITEKRTLDAAFAKLRDYVQEPRREVLVVAEPEGARDDLMAFVAGTGVPVRGASPGDDAKSRLDTDAWGSGIAPLGGPFEMQAGARRTYSRPARARPSPLSCTRRDR